MHEIKEAEMIFKEEVNDLYQSQDKLDLILACRESQIQIHRYVKRRVCLAMLVVSRRRRGIPLSKITAREKKYDLHTF